MDTAPTFGIQNVIAATVGHAANAVSQRAGESRQQQAERADAATDAIMAFQPSDAVEAILASHCLMFHEMIVADVHRTLCGENLATQRATRNGIVAMDRAFGANLIRLNQHRAAQQDVPPPTERAETDIEDRARRHLAEIEPQDRDAAVATAAESERSEADATFDAWPASQMGGLNRQARRALDRQIRKRAPGSLRQGIMPDRNEPTTTASATSAG